MIALGNAVEINRQADSFGNDRVAGIERLIGKQPQLSLRIFGGPRRDGNAGGNHAGPNLGLFRKDVTSDFVFLKRSQTAVSFQLPVSPAIGTWRLCASASASLNRNGEKTVDPIRNKPANRQPRETQIARANQTAAQFVQMLEKRHLAAEFFFLAVADWRGRKRVDIEYN